MLNESGPLESVRSLAFTASKRSSGGTVFRGTDHMRLAVFLTAVNADEVGHFRPDVTLFSEAPSWDRCLFHFILALTQDHPCRLLTATMGIDSRRLCS